MQQSVFDSSGAALSGRFRFISLMEFLVLGIIIWSASVVMQRLYTAEESATLHFLSFYTKAYLPYIWFVWAIYRFIADKKRSYWLSNKEVSYRYGWFTPVIVTLPVKRLQHVEIKQGILDRLLGLYRISVLSAGRGFTIPGLTKVDAESLRETLLESVVTEDE